ncbi:MAG TPA: response regulator [Sulfuricella sp.]|nr:response regulator [Sulfuricella sp.]
MRLLVVEDDPMIGEGIRRGLKLADFVVDWVRDGKAAELALGNGVYDLMILDLGLPRKDGLELLKQLRGQENELPVLIVTARDAVEDKVAGLNEGADDYLVKPFDLDELKARVHAVLRRRSGRSRPVIVYGALALDPIGRRVTLKDKPVSLSTKEFALLHVLMAEPGAVLSRAELEEALYGWEEEVGSNAVEVHIHNLRRKLGSRAVLNVRGAGYRVAKLNHDVDP